MGASIGPTYKKGASSRSGRGNKGYPSAGSDSHFFASYTRTGGSSGPPDSYKHFLGYTFFGGHRCSVYHGEGRGEGDGGGNFVRGDLCPF